MNYKMTNSIDGTPRLDMHVSYRMGLDEVAVFITAEKTTDLTVGGEYWDSNNPSKKAIEAILTSRQAAMKIAQTCMINYGAETPHYRVGDGNLNDIKNAVLARLTELWEG
jgi:delta-aminolevulinic acid dehydratase/porphobilinogen synthase